MDIERILNATDHTLLAQTATKEQIIALCDEGMRCKVASVCIPSSYVRTAADYVRGGLAVGVAHDLHGDQRFDAALVEQRHVVVREMVRGQCGLDLLEDVVRAGGARLDLPPFHAATGHHQPQPHALVPTYALSPT